mmetsp:Transcript_26940/g.75924  ORF Transcript_26940/g.75924 Transcript_26940/m.75924 type:complete len:85 (-) Transcript_26940:26-280(-)
MSSSKTMPQLYRAILKAAHRFPSKKRSGIIQDIKIEFRANKSVEDPKELQRLRTLVLESLEQLNSYIDLAAGSTDLYLKGPCQG